MRKLAALTACLLLATLGPAGAQEPETRSAGRPPIDFTILHAQVILDRLGFSPGILDGREGQSLTAALKAFQETRGIPTTGKLDPRTLGALHPHRAWRPLKRLAVPDQALQGPFVRELPEDPVEQGKLPAMAYSRPLEKLAEMFHTTPEVLVELNPGGGKIERGAEFRFPDVMPASHDYPANLPADWRTTLAALNVDAQQPRGERIVVDKSEGVLKVFDAGDKLVAQFTATMGSQHDPLPLGRWKINVKDYNPDFRYNPELFWDVHDSEEKVLLPPGPNSPVGVVWLDLSKEHYGIHGTPEPQNIGRTQSHGCIRLTNWDAARLAMMVEDGTVAVFQE